LDIRKLYRIADVMPMVRVDRTKDAYKKSLNFVTNYLKKTFDADVIGMGEGRVVIYLGNKVAKIAYTDNGVVDNKTEALYFGYFSNSSFYDLRRGRAKVLNVSKDGRILIMEKCHDVGNINKKELERSPAFKVTLDRHIGNYGRNSVGEIVCIDFSRRFSSNTLQFLEQWYSEQGVTVDFTRKRFKK
jgi:hypothetical protein